MTINELLTKWKKESIFGDRHFEKQTDSLYEGQELYLINIKYKVKVADS